MLNLLFFFIVGVYEQDSEPAIIADKMTRLLSEAESPLKTTQDQEVAIEMTLLSVDFQKLTGFRRCLSNIFSFCI